MSESGRSLGGGHGNSFQYSCLEMPMDRGAWWATVHRVAKSQIWLKRLSTHAQGEFLGLSLLQKELCPDFGGVNHPAATLQSWSSMWKHTRLSESSFGNKLAAHTQQASVFPNMLKDDGVKMLHSIWQQIWKTQWWQEWKMSVFILIPKKGNAKECSSYHIIAPISHASKVMLKTKLCFNSTWTKNFQMFKLDSENAEKPDFKLPTSVES